MNYEEKYKEALERARAINNGKDVDVKAGTTTCEYIFPELAESKDEKIRKEIISFLQLPHSQFVGERKQEKWIAWLEKQGETSPVLSNSSNNGKDEQKPSTEVEPKFKVGDKIYLKPECRMPSDDTPIANTVKEIIRIDDKHYRFDGSYIFIEDQDKYELVEPKTEENKGNIVGIPSNSEWSKEDEIRLNTIINDITVDKSMCKYEVAKSICDEQINWLKSLKDRVQPQPKQEWSKEEEAVLDALIRRLEGEDIYVSPHLAVECLKSLKERVQPKQEWSEEDEQHIDSLLKRLDALCRNKFERTRFAISEDREWLKSLRPQKCLIPSEEEIEKAAQEWDSKANFNPFYMTMENGKPTGVKQSITTHKESFKVGVNWILKFLRCWKPSDEQISLLQAIINEPKNATSESCQIVLKDILEQLKKLKKEQA